MEQYQWVEVTRDISPAASETAEANAKNRMTGLLAILVVASPFAYWLFRRRNRDRAEKQPTEGSPFPDIIIANESGTAISEVQNEEGARLLSQLETQTRDDVPGEAEADELAEVESGAAAYIPGEDKSAYREAEAHVAEDDIVESVPALVAEPADVLLSAELRQSISIPLNKTFQDEGRAAAVLELPDLSDSGLAEEVAADVISAARESDQEVHADKSMAERAEISVPLHTEEPLPTRGSGSVQPSEPAKGPIDGSTDKTLPRYRAPVQKPPRQVTTRPVDRATARGATSEVALEIRVRLTLDRFGFCAITFLPGRTEELDNEVAAKLGTTSLGLMAQEDWYQDLSFSDTGRYLRDGFELKGVLSDQRRARWLLKGRDVYVLAAHPRASGFVSATRLVLGRSDVVLCAAELVQEVEAVLKEAGCEGYSRLDETLGLPPGWAGFRGVSPVKAIALDVGTSDPLYAIKPAADIEIELEAGVCLRNSVWLAGYPPQIKLFGQTNAGMKVVIDGKEAQFTAEGSLVVDGYDLPGPHSVYCEGLSRSYSIEEAPDSWEAWPAYQFGETGICGASVQLPPEEAGRQAFTVPMSNPLLIGAEPGQVFRCSSRSVAIWRGFVPFDVVWALPAQPLICNKRTARILQFSDKPLMPRGAGTRPFVWCTAILDASRKGLRIEGGSQESAVRWREYKKTARSIWRGCR